VPMHLGPRLSPRALAVAFEEDRGGPGFCLPEE
jgi:hypothetical protein